MAPRTVLLLALLALASPLAGAHDEDPKILDRQPRYEGPGYRGAWARRVGMPLAATASPVAYPAQDVTLLSWVPLSEFGHSLTSANDCWGYASPSGREYAFLGTSHGTAVIEVSDPNDARTITFLHGKESLWRDIKVHGEWAYAVSEGGGGIQIFDLREIDSGKVKNKGNLIDGGTPDTHNIAIDTDSGFAYRLGGVGLRAYSLADPENPVFVGSWTDRYVHDAQVVTYDSGPMAGRQIAYCCTGFNGGNASPRLTVLDVTNKGNMQVLEHVSYSNSAYSHQAWLNEARTVLYLNDEKDEGGGTTTLTHAFNVTNPNNPSYLGQFTNGNTAIGHNLYVRGDRLYEANYRSGLRVFDVAGPGTPQEVAYFDTWPPDDNVVYASLWSNYPFLPSGVVLGSDMQRGLFVWWVGPHELEFDFPDGLPSLVDPSGDSLRVTIDAIQGAGLAAGTAELHWDLGQGIESRALVALGGDEFEAQLPALACGQELTYWFTAESDSGVLWRHPAGIQGAAHRALGASSEQALFAWDFESAAGWSVGAPDDTATEGLWVRGNPIGSLAQPEDDHSPAGSQAWFTGQPEPGDEFWEHDVDEGATSLLSPVLDLTGAEDPYVRYWRWYSNASGTAFAKDVFRVELSDDGGTSWVPAEKAGPLTDGSLGGWNEAGFRVLDHIEQLSSVRMRFIAEDLNSDSVVEAALDDVRVVELACPALWADVHSLSLAEGGSQNLTLEAGASQAGAIYLVLGSASGTSPGIALDGVVLPLVADAYTSFSLQSVNALPFVQTSGLLDASGAGAAALSLPAGSAASAAGLQLHHAYLSFELATGSASFASNAVPLLLSP